MTTRLLALTVVRRWYVALVGLLLTAGFLVHIHQSPGVYWSQVDVAFLAPKSQRFPNTIENIDASATAMAGLVASELNKGTRLPATSSSGTTLAGEGVRDGYQLRVPNSGGQWAINFDRPVIDVQVIGSDPERVKRRLAGLVSAINRELASLQDATGAPRSSYITTLSAPSAAQVFHLDGYPSRAIAVAGLIGLGSTMWTCVLVDRFVPVLRRRRSALGAAHRTLRRLRPAAG